MDRLLDWEQKLAALQVLTDTSLRMRKPGDWYVDARGRETGGNGILSGNYGNGKTPQEAVEDDWAKNAETLPPPMYVVLDAHSQSRRRHVRWNGFMWVEVPR